MKHNRQSNKLAKMIKHDLKLDVGEEIIEQVVNWVFDLLEQQEEQAEFLDFKSHVGQKI